MDAKIQNHLAGSHPPNKKRTLRHAGPPTTQFGAPLRVELDDAEALAYVLNGFSFVGQMSLARLMGASQRCEINEDPVYCKEKLLKRNLGFLTKKNQKDWQFEGYGYSATKLWSALDGMQERQLNFAKLLVKHGANVDGYCTERHPW
jgi:hypothetical protein